MQPKGDHGLHKAGLHKADRSMEAKAKRHDPAHALVV